QGEIIWMNSYIYRPKSNDGVTDQLIDKNDSGILKECSISFVYTTPECSDCGQDIRNCPHEANANNGTHFIYKGITQVLETSLVSKGSVRGTYVTDKLSAHSIKIVTIGKGGYVTEFPVACSMIPRSEAAVISLESRDDPMLEIIAHSPEIAAALAIKNGRVHLLVKSA
ncbi:MAG: hypothetical protein V3S06_07215, partial [candidate division Zixibacteria bacterium]